MDPLLVIANSGAGTSDEETLDHALDVLRPHTSIEVAETSEPDELDGVLRQAGSRSVLVAGGDGSLHAVIAALKRLGRLQDTTVGLLPLGTGNDFARGVGIPLDVDEAARVVLAGKTRRMDLIVDEDDGIVVNNVHVGAGANASRRGHRWKQRLGSVGVGKVNLVKLGYPIGAAMTAWNPPVIKVRVEVDGKVIGDPSQSVLMVAVGNGASVGGGAELTPEADPRDGEVDVMISRAVGPVSRVMYAARIASATHHERDDVTYLNGRTVSVTGGPFWSSADGELDGPLDRKTWRLEPSAYAMYVP